MNKNFKFNFTGYQMIDDGFKFKLQEKLTEDLSSSHLVLSVCHSDIPLVTANFDLTGIFFNGTVQCSCGKYLIQFDGNTNSSTISYSLVK